MNGNSYQSTWGDRLKCIREHLVASCLGWVCILAPSPGFAVRLLLARIHFFLTRALGSPLTTPTGLRIDTPSLLISYWNLFIERGLYSRTWGRPFKSENAPLVVDIGANAGVFSHWVLSMNPAARIVAFEPLPAMASRLHRDLEARHPGQIEIIEKACAATDGVQNLYFDNEGDTTASLVDGARNRQHATAITTTRLDSIDLRQDIFLIKIDTEGMEPEVLAGAKTTLGRARFLIIEAHDTPAVERIRHILKDWIPQRLDVSNWLFYREDTAKPGV